MAIGTEQRQPTPNRTRSAHAADLATVARALRMLVHIAENHPQGVTELSLELGYPKAVAHRLAATLVSYGFLNQDPESKRYHIGPQAFRVGQAFDIAGFASEVTQDTLRRLVAEHGHSAYVAVLSDTEALIVATFPGHSPIRVDSATKGQTRTVYSTAVGKALLANLPPAKLGDILDRLTFKAHTGRTVTTRKALEREIALTRSRGFALSDQESLNNVTSVGVALPGLIPDAPIAISVSVPSFTFNDETMLKLANEVRAAGDEIRARVEGIRASGRAGSEG